jgi:hypothetical protein
VKNKTDEKIVKKFSMKNKTYENTELFVVQNNTIT